MKLKFIIEDLLEECKAGNKQAWDLLYRHTSRKMFAICMRYAKNRMEAEDILQTSYVKVFQKIREYRGEGSFEGWIKRIIINCAIESYRKNLHTLKVVQFDQEYEQPITVFDFSHLEMQDLMKVIQKLSDGYRIVFNMYVIEGYSHKEIGKMLGISEKASRTQLSRARAILKQKILKLEKFYYETNGR